jgi:anthranilate synthase component I
MDPPAKLDIRPTVGDAQKLFEQTRQATPRPTLLPICITFPSDLLTPSAIYLKLSAGYAPPSGHPLISPSRAD